LGEALVGPVVDLPEELAERPAQLVRTAEPVAVPERHLAGLAGRGRHDDAVAGDLLDAPRAGAEHERLADARLVDHLLVELTAARPLRREDAVQTAVGNGAAARDCEHACPVPGALR